MKGNFFLVLFILILCFWNFTLDANEARGGILARLAGQQDDSTLEVAVEIETDTTTGEMLGSFTGDLRWDPAGLKFLRYTGGSTPGFEGPVVNHDSTVQGRLYFSNAYPYGGAGKVNIMNIYFIKSGKTDWIKHLRLSFTAMAAARTFKNLLPDLTITQHHKAQK
jgi:hypothetical protein